MRTIRRDEMEPYAPLRLGQPVADKLGVMIAGDCPGTRGSARHRRIQGLDGHQKRNGAHGGQPLAPRGYGSGRFQGQWPRECSCAYVRSSGQPRPWFPLAPSSPQAAPHGSDAPRRRTAPLRRWQRVHQGLISLMKAFCLTTSSFCDSAVRLAVLHPQTMKQRNQPRAALINDAELLLDPRPDMAVVRR